MGNCPIFKYWANSVGYKSTLCPPTTSITLNAALQPLGQPEVVQVIPTTSINLPF